MKLFLAAIYVLLYITAGGAKDFGPIDVSVLVGNVTERKPSTPEDVIVSDKIITVLEYLRRFMSTGLGDDIPPFDPYVNVVMEPAVFEAQGSSLKGLVKLTNLVVVGAKSYSIDVLEVNLDTARVDFEFSLPELQAEIDYSTVNFEFDEIIRFNSSGHLKASMTNLKLKGGFNVVVVAPDNFVIGGIQLHTHADDVQIELVERLLSGSSFPQEAVQEAVQEVVQVVATAFANTAVRQMDDILQKYSVPQIKAIVYG